MKKMIVCLMSLFLLASCSDDKDVSFTNDVKTKSNSDPLMEMKVAVNAMLHSEDFKTFDALTAEFKTKLNVEVDETIFENDETLLSWIDTNLEKTKFLSVQEAQLDLKEIGNVMDQIYVDNEFVFSTFPNYNQTEAEEIFSYYLEILMSEDPIYENVVYDDGCPCSQDLLKCHLAAFKTLTIKITVAKVMNSLAGYVQAEIEYRSNFRPGSACVDNFKSCMNSGICN